jgi:adenine-specific DNA methylase
MSDEPGGCQEQSATTEWSRQGAKFATHHSSNDQCGRKDENKLAPARWRQHTTKFKPFGSNGKNEERDPPPGDIGSISSNDPQKRSACPACGRNPQYESEQRRLSCDKDARIKRQSSARKQKSVAGKGWPFDNESKRTSS